MKQHRRRYYFPNNVPLLHRLYLETCKHYEPIPSFPEDIQIQTVTGCNASCVFCPNGKTKNPIPFAKMEEDLYRKIVDECLSHNVKRISPYLMNEPLLDKAIGEKIRYIADRKDKRPSIKINTNASMLKGPMINSLLTSGLDRLNISFHGMSKKTYEESMQGLNYEAVLANVNDFIREKERRKAHKPKVSIVMVKTKQVEQELDAIRQYWGKRKVGTHIRALENRANRDIQQKKLNPEKWHAFNWCKRLFTQAYILANGDMVLCCVDWERTTVLGNVRTHTIKEVWNSQKAVDIRKNFLSGHTEGLLCHACLKQA